MTYVKQEWKNLPDQTTPLSAARLNHLETQFDEAKSYADSIAGGGARADLVSALRFPVYIAHRGAPRVRPEHSIEAYRHAFESGFSPEADVQALSDGTLVCLHDSTTSRTMNLSKPVSSVTVAEWRSATVNPPSIPGVTGTGIFGTAPGTPVFFEDYLDEFGGKTVLWPEIKTTNATAITAAIKAITDRGLHRAVVIQSGNRGTLQQAVAAGCVALRLTNDAPPSEFIQDGVEFAGVSDSATQTYINSLLAEGIKVIGYTQNTKEDADDMLSKGCAGVFSDDPWSASQEFTRRVTLGLDDGWIPPASRHSIENLTASEPGGHNQKVTVSSGTLLFTMGRSSGTQYSYSNSIRLGQLGLELPPSVTLRFWAQSIVPNSTAAPESTWMFGLYFGRQEGGVAINEEPLESMFRLAMVRRSGAKHFYEKRTLTSATSSLGTVAAPATPYAVPGGRSIPMQFEVSFTPTGGYIRNLTLGDSDLVVTATSLQIPGSYLSLGVNGATSRIWDIQVSS